MVKKSALNVRILTWLQIVISTTYYLPPTIYYLPFSLSSKELT